MTRLFFSGSRALLGAALLLLTPRLARADEPVPTLNDQKGKTLDVQVLGWSKDEQRYALRVYDLTELFDEAPAPPACKGYVTHEGKKFLGGLSFALYEGGKRIEGWRIQDAKKCTPPKTAAERLTKAKAALAEKGIDLTATGATLVAVENKSPTLKDLPKGTEFRNTKTVVVPHGPAAGKQLVADELVLHNVKTQKDEDGEEGFYEVVGQGTVKLSLGSGKDAVALGEFKMGPGEPGDGGPWVWDTGFDRAFLSPSGKWLVALAYIHHGDMRLNDAPRILMAPVDLSQKVGTASAPVSTPTKP